MIGEEELEDEEAERALARRGRELLLGACILLTLGLGIAKVFVQRAHRPSYLHAAHVYHGWPSIDGHSLKAERIRTWMTGGDPGAASLREFLSDEGHPSSLVVQTAVAALSLFVGSIPVTFMLLSALAFCLQIALVVRLAWLCAGEVRPWVPALAGILAAGHVLSVRTAAQLHLDPFCALIATAVLVATLEQAREPRRGRAAWLGVLLTLGLFTKISLLPLLAVPPLVLAARAPGRRLATLVRAGLAFSLPPLVIWGAALWLVTGGGPTTTEPGHLLKTWELDARQLRNFGIEMVLLLQAFPVLLLLRRREWSADERAVGMVLILLLAATWAFRLPAIPRLYLPTVGLMAVLGAAQLAQLLPPRLVSTVVALYLLANYGLGIVGLLGQVP